jgi:hypothetical protein
MKIGWIDFSKKQRNKVISVINLLREKEALDELGIGTIRDGFADIFFPGTSTIQTRAKYFLLVPYLLSEIEKMNLTPDKMLEKLHDAELNMIDILQRNSPPGVQHIIGVDAGWELKRKPSEIYWNGIRTFGIFKGGKMSLYEYLKLNAILRERKKADASLGNNRKTGDKNDADDIKANAAGLIGGFWCLPEIEEGWKESVSIELTKKEAVFLKNRIISSAPDSMLSFVLREERADFVEYRDFGDLSKLKPFMPVQMAEDFELAKGFADFIYGAYIRFNLMMSKGKDGDCLSEWDRWRSESALHASYDLHAMFTRLRRNKVNISEMQRRFLLDFQEAVRKGNEELMGDIITKREIFLKGKNRSKLYNAERFEYTGWVGIRRLNYRLPSAQRLVGDIFAGVNKDNA